MKIRWVLACLFIGAAVYYALFGGDYGFFDLRRLEREKAAEELQVKQLSNEVDSLRLRRDSLETDSATLERIAREKYGLIRDGERLYRFVDSAGADTTRRDSTTRR